MTRDHADWSYPTSIRAGTGRIEEAASTCIEFGIENPLVVTDPGLVELDPVVKLGASLAAMPHGVFSDLRPNPVGRDVEAGVDAYLAGGHDGVIAIGGGSALDVGKLVALMVGQDRPLWDFEDVGDNWRRAEASRIAPVVAVPTTAGTGSEVGRAGVVLDEATQRKVIVFHPKLMPVAVIADPELTVGLPRALTVGTGLDALSHSLEAICSPVHHPMSHGIGMEGCRLVFEHLPTAADAPGDLEARSRMLTAAAMGAVAFQKGLGAMHALAHPIGARCDTHHGMTNAVLMPYVLVANRPAIEDTIVRLGRYVGISGGFDGVLQHVIDLRAALDVPPTLIDLGVAVEAVDAIAAAAVIDPSAATNPVPVDVDFAHRVFAAACAGDIG